MLSFCESHFMDGNLIVHLFYMHTTESTPTSHGVLRLRFWSYIFSFDIKPIMLHILSLWMLSLLLYIVKFLFRKVALSFDRAVIFVPYWRPIEQQNKTKTHYCNSYEHIAIF